MKILFTAVGGSDPIKRMLDGPMLHCVRVYKPDIVYMYLTKYTLQYENLDGRYSWVINKLAKEINKDIKIEKIERDKILEAHLFDSFYKDLEEVLCDIFKKHENDEIYVNVSSGTPAIKSTLVVISAMARRPINVIQISSGEAKPLHDRDRDDTYDKELQWECDTDNTDAFKDRTVIVKSDRLLVKLKKNNIENHLLNYDYSAALNTAKEIKTYLNDGAYALLEAANSRINLDYKEVERILKDYDIDIIPQKNSGKVKFAEYILWLGVVLKRGDYLSFIRGITPIAFELMNLALESTKVGSIGRYCDDKGRLLTKKMQETEIGNDMLKVLNDEYNTYKDKYCGTDQLELLLKEFSNNPKVIDCASRIRYVEEEVRNEAAHTIIYLNDDIINSKTNMTANDIYDTIKEFAIILGVLKNEMWTSYEDMNNKILELLYTN